MMDYSKEQMAKNDIAAKVKYASLEKIKAADENQKRVLKELEEKQKKALKEGRVV